MTTCLPLNFFSSSRTRRVFEKIKGKVLIRKSPEVNENTTIKFSNDSFHQNLQFSFSGSDNLALIRGLLSEIFVISIKL